MQKPIPEYIIETCWKRGNLHAETRPAMVYRNKNGKKLSEIWFLGGVPHRREGPAAIHWDRFGRLRSLFFIEHGSIHKIMLFERDGLTPAEIMTFHEGRDIQIQLRSPMLRDIVSVKGRISFSVRPDMVAIDDREASVIQTKNGRWELKDCVSFTSTLTVYSSRGGEIFVSPIGINKEMTLGMDGERERPFVSTIPMECGWMKLVPSFKEEGFERFTERDVMEMIPPVESCLDGAHIYWDGDL